MFLWRPLVAPQVEGSECGYLCASVLAQMYGIAKSPHDLKLLVGSSNRGLTIRQLKSLLSQIGMQTQAVAVDFLQLKILPSPVIALTTSHHYLVLGKRRIRNRIDVFDPIHGWRVLPRHQVVAQLSGLLVEPVSAMQQRSGKLRAPSVRAIFSNLGVPLQIVLLALIGAVTLAAQLAIPKLTGDAIDLGTKDLTFDFFHYVLVYALFVGLALLVNAAAQIRGAFFGAFLNDRLSSRLFERLFQQSQYYFEQHSPNALFAKFDSLFSLHTFVSKSGATIILSTLLAVTSFAVMVGSNAPLSGISLVSLLAYFATAYAMRGMLLHARENNFQSRLAHRGFILDATGAASAIKRFAGTDSATTKHQNLLREVTTSAKSEAVALTLHNTLTQALGHIDRLAFSVVGILAVQSGQLSMGGFFAFGLYREYFRHAIEEMVGVVYDISLLRVQRLRLGELLPNPPERHAAQRVAFGFIHFDQVSYRYTEFEPWVLSGFTLDVCPGEFVLVQGESGSGKSTLAKLILGLASPTKGAVLVDGFVPADGMAGTAAVLQGDRLISDSIYNNIVFFRSDFDESDVDEAAKAAEIYDFVHSLPMRFNTPVSDDYAGLSAGQRQRVLLARALLAKPSLIVLDEATSHLDIETESRILKKIRAIPGTKVVISHRPDVAVFADRVVSMSTGSVDSVKVVGT